MHNHRFLLIYNPTAGKGKAAGLRESVEQLMTAAGLDWELRLTERIGHAQELARTAAAQGFTVAVACGGDGTVNEVINGLMKARLADEATCVLGVLPVGRGNDFAYGANIPKDLEQSVRVLATSEARPMDVGCITGGDYPDGKFFGNGIGIGFDTIVGLEAAHMRFVHGFMAYVFGALKTFVLYPSPVQVRFEWDHGVIEHTTHQISIMNGKRMGGTFFMAPEADNADGLLDLCMAGVLSRGAMLKLMAMYTKGSQSKDPLIKTGRSKRFHITAPNGGLIVHADGETVCVNGQELLIECVPAALQILCAEKAAP